MWRRPAVSRKDEVAAELLRVGYAGLGYLHGVALAHLENGDAQLLAHGLQLLFIAAGRYTSQATSSGRLPCFFMSAASFAPFVVLPAPCRPTSMQTLGLFEEMLSCGSRCP